MRVKRNSVKLNQTTTIKKTHIKRISIKVPINLNPLHIKLYDVLLIISFKTLQNNEKVFENDI